MHNKIHHSVGKFLQLFPLLGLVAVAQVLFGLVAQLLQAEQVELLGFLVVVEAR